MAPKKKQPGVKQQESGSAAATKQSKGPAESASTSPHVSTAADAALLGELLDASSSSAGRVQQLVQSGYL
jgi:hypothetical protein